MGLWPIFFVDLVIECMANPDQPRGLCCLPVTLRSKYYPLILIVIFSLFFGFQVDFWCGLAVGYLYAYGAFSRFDLGSNRATALEKKFPFTWMATRSNFITAGGAMGGEILPVSQPRSTASESSSS